MSVQTDSPLVEMVEDSIRRGFANATLIEWVYREHPATLIEEAHDEPDPVASICMAALEFKKAGWFWDTTLDRLEKDGWMIWFRSQGKLSPPIIQWSRIAAHYPAELSARTGETR